MPLGDNAPAYYECGTCGFYHPKGGECHGAARFTPDELDELYGQDQWDEVHMDEPEPVAAVAKPETKNLIRLSGVTAQTDLEGNVLEPGCAVRAFDFYCYDAETDSFAGINTIGDRVSYIEGKLVAIDEPEGRYTIRIERETQHVRQTGRITAAEIRSRPGSALCYPPVNGTMTSMGWPTFGVFRIK